MVKNIFNTVKNFRPTLFSVQAQVVKILNVKRIFNTVKNFRATLFFQGKRKLLKNRDGEKMFNTVYIHLGAIRVIWAGVVCNLDQNHD